ncbi:hypothetical protein NUU61_002243 [Penicillium alfredii]|uniref:Uncharacterized protein n=1 Tax=Penicillium alfredii TaxID=1506179 RepID=A0A9W9KGG0_9EURO|nr:uncharacterized protein NUU61_002243 [Penicillium alfredii]KAJ5104896.1 hypothetical protein NUU61_002243 [Penicillium alfredii]
MRTQLLELAERQVNTLWSRVDEVYTFADLPGSMKDWLESGQANFSGDPVTTEDDLAHAYQEAFHPDEVRDDLQDGFKRMVFSLFCRHRSSTQRSMVFHTIAEFVEILSAICNSLDDAIPWVRPDKKILSRISSGHPSPSPQPETKEPSVDTGLADKIQRVMKVIPVVSTPEHLELPPNPLPLKPATPSSLSMTSEAKLPYIMVPLESSIVERKCVACARPSNSDEEPRFWSQDTRLYIARQSVCDSDECNGRKRWMIPASTEFGYVRGSLEYLSAKPRKDGRLRAGIKDYLFEFDEAPEELQRPVSTKCKACGTEGKTEVRPQWTKDTPPIYHAMERACRSEFCHPNKRRLFIPVDPIPYITTKALWVRQKTDDKS